MASSPVTVTADVILSSAGLAETLLLCADLNDEMRDAALHQAGTMTFMESISVLDTLPENIGHSTTITFFNNSANAPCKSLIEMELCWPPVISTNCFSIPLFDLAGAALNRRRPWLNAMVSSAVPWN